MKMYAFVRSNVPRALAHQTTSSISIKLNQIKNNDNEPEPSTPSNGEAGTESSNGTSQLRYRNHVNESSELKSDSDNLESRRRTLVKRDSWISWDDEESPCPDYSKYLYFLFVPTLIYKDSYPR